MPVQIVTLVALLGACAHSHGTPWPAHDPSRLPKGDVLIQPGRYLLLMVATGGSKEDSTASGVLTLRQALDGDRSPHTGEGPRVGSLASEKPTLWGFTDLDFRRIGALLHSGDHGNGIAIAPSSDDPIYPGVLGFFEQHGSRKLQYLTIGTTRHRRGGLSLDGYGISLQVERLQDGTLSGIWSPMGFVAAGWGTWSMTPLGR